MPRGRKEHWQTLEWWASLDVSSRQKIMDALQDYTFRTRRRRPRKSEMKSLIEKALGIKRGRRKKAAPQDGVAQ